MSIAFFDFDGTITKSDSLKSFLVFYFNPLQLLLKTIRFSPYLCLYFLGRIDNSSVKEKLFQTFFSGENNNEFNKKCIEFAESTLSKKRRAIANEKLKWHKDKKHEIAIVSASIENYLIPLFKEEKIRVIATQLEVVDNKLTGNFSSPNCYGEEKRKRVLKQYDLKNYDEIYAYGDSRGDQELLDLATQSFFKKFF